MASVVQLGRSPTFKGGNIILVFVPRLDHPNLPHRRKNQEVNTLATGAKASVFHLQPNRDLRLSASAIWVATVRFQISS